MIETFRRCLLVILMVGGGVTSCAPGARGDARSGAEPAASPPHRDTIRRGLIIADTDREIWPDPRDRTEVRMEALRTLIVRFLERNGALPARLDEVVPRERDDPFAGFSVDGWERPFRFVPRDQDYELGSAGADGRFGTGDDIVVTRSQGTRWSDRDPAAPPPAKRRPGS